MRLAGVCGQRASYIELVVILAQPRDRSKCVRPVNRIFKIRADAGFPDAIASGFRELLPRSGIQQAIADRIPLALDAECDFAGAAEQREAPRMACVERKTGAVIGLSELIAVDWVVEKVREIRVYPEPVIDDVSVYLGCRVLGGAMPGGGQAVAMNFATSVGSIELNRSSVPASTARLGIWSVAL